MRDAASNAPAINRLLRASILAIGWTLLFGPALALAQTASPEIQSKTVPSGETRQLAFLTSLNPDCSVDADMTLRIVKQASHGAVEVDRGVGYTNYGRRDWRHFCNLAPREGYKVTYASHENFKGDDEFEIEFFGPAGSYSVTRYAVTVK